MRVPLERAPLLKGKKLNERPGVHSDNYGLLKLITLVSYIVIFLGFANTKISKYLKLLSHKN